MGRLDVRLVRVLYDAAGMGGKGMLGGGVSGGVKISVYLGRSTVAHCGRIFAGNPVEPGENAELFGERHAFWNEEFDLSNVGVGSGEMGGWNECGAVSRTTAN